MRRKRIHLRYARHGSRERRTDRSSRADEISVFLAEFDESLRDDVEHREAVRYDRIQLGLEALFDDLRERVAVHVLRSRPAFFGESLFGAFEMRRIGALRYRADPLYHIGYEVRILHNYLICLFAAEI